MCLICITSMMPLADASIWHRSPTSRPLSIKSWRRSSAANGPAILRWMIDGCLDWRRNGLIRPAAVTASTADYFSDQDLLAQWIEDCCEIAANVADTVANLLASWRNTPRAAARSQAVAKGSPWPFEREATPGIRDDHGIRGRGFQGIKVHVTSNGTHRMTAKDRFASDRHVRRILPITAYTRARAYAR